LYEGVDQVHEQSCYIGSGSHADVFRLEFRWKRLEFQKYGIECGNRESSVLYTYIMFRPKPNAASGPSRAEQPVAQADQATAVGSDIIGGEGSLASLPTPGDEGFISRMMADK
jgi:hypothetical protein